MSEELDLRGTREDSTALLGFIYDGNGSSLGIFWNSNASQFMAATLGPVSDDTLSALWEST